MEAALRVLQALEGDKAKAARGALRVADHHRILQLAVLLKVLPELIIGQLPGAAHKQLVRWLLAAAATAASAATPTATALIGAGHGALGLDALAVDDVVLVHQELLGGLIVGEGDEPEAAPRHDDRVGQRAPCGAVVHQGILRGARVQAADEQLTGRQLRIEAATSAGAARSLGGRGGTRLPCGGGSDGRSYGGRSLDGRGHGAKVRATVFAWESCAAIV
mmetsp:Transcript_39668/g.101387  ORF Transcript_39668/g.101387 Transcript_39668/m.101387 type:complete len:220 (-) Transcript_39668:61-720(-)